MARNTDGFYRGKKKRKKSAVAITVVLLLLIAVAALLIYGPQKYIVITNDGLHLEIPFLSDGSKTPTDSDTPEKRSFEEVNAVVEIGETDYDSVEAVAGERLEPIKAKFVPFDSVTEEGIASAAADMGKADTLMLELKTEKGQLAYASQTDIARGYGTAGELDLGKVISSLHDDGIKVAVRLCCFVDDALASRYQKLALCTSGGKPFTDDSGSWLDPTSSTVRGYIISLCRELDKLGVDEIVLSTVRLPDPGENSFAFAVTNGLEQTPQTVISGFAMKLTRSLSSLNAALSIQISSSTALNSLDTETGQSAGFLFKLFDRIYLYSSTQNAGSQQETAGSKLELGEVKCRFVPMCYDGAAGTSSWVVMG